ncbi:MAG: hypothetical protein M3Y82_06055, partial [Verrucomicrobiota bacterium]|nr:hypothetical protein [Verrucomicrobiota bacterium]
CQGQRLCLARNVEIVTSFERKIIIFMSEAKAIPKPNSINAEQVARVVRFGLVAIVLLVSFYGLVGCATSGHQTPLHVWRGPDSTLQQRADAVSELIPIGTSRQRVESILGTKGAWTRSHGRNVQVIWSKNAKPSSRPLPNYDVWSLEYEFLGGTVSLYFDPPTAMGNKFVRASFNVNKDFPAKITPLKQ